MIHGLAARETLSAECAQWACRSPEIERVSTET
jgi:hypothetical protein